MRGKLVFHVNVFVSSNKMEKKLMFCFFHKLFSHAKKSCAMLKIFIITKDGQNK